MTRKYIYIYIDRERWGHSYGSSALGFLTCSIQNLKYSFSAHLKFYYYYLTTKQYSIISTITIIEWVKKIMHSFVLLRT